MLSTPAPASAPPVVTLDGVLKRFASGTLALDRLDLTIRAGEFVSLLGPSGCGKSTALRLIAGLSEPSGGTIAWSAGAAPRARDIGFGFQEPPLMPWTTVAGNAALPLTLRHARAADAAPRVAAALARVGLTDFR